MGKSQFTHFSVNLDAIYKKMWVFIGIYLILTFQSVPGSVVECLSRDLGVAGLNLTGVTALCS